MYTKYQRYHTCTLKDDTMDQKDIQFCLYQKNKVIITSYFQFLAPSQTQESVKINNLDKLLESTVERRADIWNILPEVDSLLRALGDTFWSELEFLELDQYC